MQSKKLINKTKESENIRANRRNIHHLASATTDDNQSMASNQSHKPSDSEETKIMKRNNPHIGKIKNFPLTGSLSVLRNDGCIDN